MSASAAVGNGPHASGEAVTQHSHSQQGLRASCIRTPPFFDVSKSISLEIFHFLCIT